MIKMRNAYFLIKSVEKMFLKINRAFIAEKLITGT